MPERPFGPLPLLAGLLVAGAAVIALDAFLIEPESVELTRHDLLLPDLPEEWISATLVHLTDLHFGDPRSHRLLRRMVETVNDLEPDLVAITGDFVMNRPAEVEHALAYVGRLRSRRGSVAVVGDHDFDPSTRRLFPGLTEGLEALDVHVLRNEAIEIGGLRVAGVDPLTFRSRRADLDRALQDLDQPPHLLLSHSPDILPQASARKVPMVLCGHTHGGQVVVPFYGPPVTHSHLGREHASGWSSLDGTRMYTGRGLASHLSLRFLCRPEIALFTLRSASPAAVLPGKQ